MIHKTSTAFSAQRSNNIHQGLAPENAAQGSRHSPPPTATTRPKALQVGGGRVADKTVKVTPLWRV